MNIIEEIKTKLTCYPNARYEIEPNHVCVIPTSDSGFTVDLYVNDDEYTVHFNGWHESFTEQDEALNCFAFGLSNGCRLKEFRRSGFAYKWTVEYKEQGNWIEDSTTGLLLFPFWGKREIRLLQNGLIFDEADAV
jgi:hypothetical protein